MEHQTDTTIILASQSPRRQELLKLLRSNFEIQVSDVDETFPAGMEPAQVVEGLAARKARAVHDLRPDTAVIGADTIVVIDGDILGKPADRSDAEAMLRRLSGRTHQVYTGVAICAPGRMEVFSCCTDVCFAALSDEDVSWYLSTDEPYDKAGAYGIQGYGARLIEGIHGDFFNVMGLPVCELSKYLRKMGV